jgi:hypothetical protein
MGLIWSMREEFTGERTRMLRIRCGLGRSGMVIVGGRDGGARLWVGSVGGELTGGELTPWDRGAGGGCVGYEGTVAVGRGGRDSGSTSSFGEVRRREFRGLLFVRL